MTSFGADIIPGFSWLRVPSRSPLNLTRDLLIGVLLGVGLSTASQALASYVQARRQDQRKIDFPPRPIELRSDDIVDGVTGLIGNTPLIRINSLSDALGVEILGKAEFLNPGGSVKDRVALRIINNAEHQGLIYPHQGSRIFEGTVGSTGISIATIAAARGYKATIILPDDVAEEKARALTSLGAEVEKVRPASIVDQKQFVNLAKRRALEFGKTEVITESDNGAVEVVITTQATPDRSANPSPEIRPRGFFADQFENQSNYEAHFEGTGPEIWRQTNGSLDAFVSGAGTGGTIAGAGAFLKTMNREIQVILADPEGSGLYNKVKYGVMYDSRESEGTKRRHQVDTVVEGIGIHRLTKNFELALPFIDDAYRVTDAEAVNMSRYLVEHDGLFLGSSSACNLVACVRLAKMMSKRGGPNKIRIVTILCDSGNRHHSKFWNDDYLRRVGIPIDQSIIQNMLQKGTSQEF